MSGKLSPPAGGRRALAAIARPKACWGNVWPFGIWRGERFAIRAKVTSICGYLEHADQQGLVVEFVTGTPEWLGKIRHVHGDEWANYMS